MTFGDLINAIYEGGASLAILNHCRVLNKQKQVHGTSIISIVFFTSWGFWNMYYYNSLGQTFSWAAGFAVCFVNCYYVYLLMKYRKN